MRENIFIIKAIRILFLITPVTVQAQFTYTLDQQVVVKDFDGDELPMPWAGGLNAAHHNTIDLDGDGKLDLVLFDRTADKISTFLNQNNKYVYTPEYESFFPEDITNWMLLRDYNCDGKKDLFTGNILGIKVYTNTTSPGEPPSWSPYHFFSGFPGPKSEVLLTKGFSGKINLQLQFDDLPALIDADGDGDLDIFNVRFVGNGTVEYHQNFSVERYGTCDSLDFERITQKWGDFTECACGTFAFNGADCPSGGRTQHAGGKSLLAIDVDGNSSLDLLFSEASCFNLYLLKNTGTLTNPIFTTASLFPQANPVNFSIFPAAFYEDLNFDGLKDLVAIPNIFSKTSLSSNLKESNWLYTNSGSATAPAFTLAKKNFLQEDMIDVGDNAVPAFIDYDLDGDYDLFVSQQASASYFSKVTHFENIGSASVPSFKIVDTDRWQFSQSNLYNLRIQFADIDNDGRVDLVFTATSFGNGSTRLYYINAKSGSAAPDFDNQPLQSTNFNIGSSENILVTDVNRDGFADLLVGMANGSLAYWRNDGVGGALHYTLENDHFLGLGPSVLRQNIACWVADLDSDGKADLVFGDQRGKLSIISDFREAIDATNATTDIVFNSLTATYESRNLGGHLWPTSTNLFNTTKPAIIVGNVLGGISILRHDERESLPTEPNIAVYPNPLAKDEALSIKVDRPAYLQVFSAMGQQVTEPIYIPADLESSQRIPHLSAAVYILRFTINSKSYTRRLIIY